MKSVILAVVLTVVAAFAPSAFAGPLLAGAAKVDITDVDAGPVNDPLYAKALVVKDEATVAVIITVDAVAIAEIGTIKNDYLAKVRAQLQQDLGIKPEGVLVNASHCHGKVCKDVVERTVQSVKEAWKKVVPVRVGVGRGHEDRVMENRRLKLQDGREADVRHAYSLPPDSEVAGVGPVDPEIGLLRLDTLDGKTLAIVYNFACHPIQGVPNNGNTADMSGFASRVLEDSFDEGTIALFLQGCGGDINPALYKDVAQPRDSEVLGSLLGLSAMRGAKKIACQDTTALRVINQTIPLPRRDLAERIDLLTAEQERLVKSLGGTSLNLKTFLSLAIRPAGSEVFPSYYSHRYLHERARGRDDLARMDAENRKNMEAYIKNVYSMEELTRVQTNLALLKMHQAQNVAAGKRTVDVELVGLRIGAFTLLTFPGELTVQIGLNLKKEKPQPYTFIAGYTNGYIYYAPTADQLRNPGHAQEDCDCILAPEWQAIFEAKALEMLKGL